MDIIKVSKKFAKIEYKKNDKKHQWSHVENVMCTALKLVKFYPAADLEILELAIIFHDIDYHKYETHVEESIKLAEKFLKKNNYPNNKIAKVLQVMIAHSGPHIKKLGKTKLIEGKIIYDSDKFQLIKTKSDYEEYFNRFYLNETRNLLKKLHLK